VYTIKKHKKEYYEYEISDLIYGSCIRIIPELGGILSGFKIKGQELICFNPEKLLAKDFAAAGGNAILFPVAGKLTNDSYKLEEQKYDMQKHGFAREMPWQVTEIVDGEHGRITLELMYNEETLKVYPFKFHLKFTYVLDGNSLHINQEYINEGEGNMPFYSGFHPFFIVGDKKKLKFNISADKYVDYTGINASNIKSEAKDYNGGIDFDKPVDFVFPLKESQYSMEDSAKGRKILIETSDEFKFMVMWTPIGKNFVCIEPWIAAPDALNTGKELCIAKPGESVKTWVRYEGQ